MSLENSAIFKGISPDIERKINAFEFAPISLVKASLISARERGDKDPYWDEIEKKLEGK